MKSEEIPISVSPKDEPKPLVLDDERHREAYRLRRRGVKVSDIASKFGVDVRTVHRWVRSYYEAYRQCLEETPVVNLIAEEVADLKDLEHTAMQAANDAVDDCNRRGYFNLVLKTMRARHQLLLEVGVLPKEPTKIYNAVQEFKPHDVLSSSEDEDGRTEEEMRSEIMNLLRHARTI